MGTLSSLTIAVFFSILILVTGLCFHFVDFLDVWIYLLDSRLFIILFILFICSFFHDIITSVFGALFNIKTDINEKFFEVNYIALTFLADKDTAFMTHIFIPSAALTIFNDISEQLSISQASLLYFSSPPIYLHAIHFSLNLSLLIALLWILLRSLSSFISTKSILPLSISSVALECILSASNTMYRHFLSFSAYKSQASIEQRAYISGLACDLARAIAFAVYTTLRLYYSFWQWSNLFIALLFCAKLGVSIANIVAFFDVYTFVYQKLPQCPPEKLAQDDICIICRNKMSADDSKILPCSHCYHSECLEMWLLKQPKCPLCNKDLSGLMLST